MQEFITPQEIELEEVVLGSMLLESECATTVFEILHADCFYKDANRIIFSAIENLSKRKEAVDIMTVTKELRRIKKLDDIGGAYYIAQLADRIASTSNIEFHARIVLQAYIKRKIIQVSTNSIADAYDEGKDCLDTLDSLLAEGKAIYDHITFGKTFSTKDILTQLMDDIEHKETKGLSTGIKALDDYIVCLEKGLKYTIAGHPSQGKTSLSKTIAVNLINQGAPGIIFSMEMTEKQFMITIVSGICEIDSERIRKKEITEAEKVMIWNKMKDFKKELLIIDGKSNVTSGYLTKRVKKAIKTHKIEWFIVDYTQMCKSDKKNQSKEERISEFSQEIKSIAKTENIIGIELAQLTKVAGDKESKRPHVSDIRDSGMIEASADCIFLLYRPEHYGFTTVGPNKESCIGLAEIIIGKNRQGRIGSVLAQYTKQYTKFKDKQEIQYTPQDNQIDNEHVF